MTNIILVDMIFFLAQNHIKYIYITNYRYFAAAAAAVVAEVVGTVAEVTGVPGIVVVVVAEIVETAVVVAAADL